MNKQGVLGKGIVVIPIVLLSVLVMAVYLFAVFFISGSDGLDSHGFEYKYENPFLMSVFYEDSENVEKEILVFDLVVSGDFWVNGETENISKALAKLLLVSPDNSCLVVESGFVEREGISMVYRAAKIDGSVLEAQPRDFGGNRAITLESYKLSDFERESFESEKMFGDGDGFFHRDYSPFVQHWRDISVNELEFLPGTNPKRVLTAFYYGECGEGVGRYFGGGNE